MVIIIIQFVMKRLKLILWVVTVIRVIMMAKNVLVLALQLLHKLTILECVQVVHINASTVENQRVN